MFPWSQRFESGLRTVTQQWNATERCYFSKQRTLPWGRHVDIKAVAWSSGVYCVTTCALVTLRKHCSCTWPVKATFGFDACWHISGLQCNCQSMRDSCALGWQTAIWEWVPFWLRMADSYLILCHFPQWFIFPLEPIFYSYLRWRDCYSCTCLRHPAMPRVPKWTVHM